MQTPESSLKSAQVESMEKRLQRLERSNRHLRLGCFLGVICVAALGSMGASNRQIEPSKPTSSSFADPMGIFEPPYLRTAPRAALCFWMTPGRSRAFSRQTV